MQSDNIFIVFEALHCISSIAEDWPEFATNSQFLDSFTKVIQLL